MKSKRVMLEPGKLYNLNGHEEKNLLCLRILEDDYYSQFSAVVRSSTTGWTMMVHGTNIYPDGSIDWDFSTNGFYSKMEV